MGIILFELFTGARPFKGETPMSRLVCAGEQTGARSARHPSDLPPYLSQIIVRCLERDPALRYQRVEEILADLDAHKATERPWRVVWRRPASWKGAVAAVVVLAVAAASVLVARAKRRSTAAPATSAAAGPTVSLAILPFRNTSGDPALAWLGTSLAEMLRTDIGQSAYLRTVSADRLDQTLRDLRISPDAGFDADGLRRLSEFTNADTLLWGQYLRVGEQIRIDATLQDYKQQRTVPLKVEASQREGALEGDRRTRAVGSSRTVATSPDIVKELQANAFKPSSTSLQALRDYNDGLQLERRGNNLDALKRFESATSADPEFALAYSRLAQTHANLGQDTAAEQASRRAVELEPEAAATRAVPDWRRSRANLERQPRRRSNRTRTWPRFRPRIPTSASTWDVCTKTPAALDKAQAEYAKVLARDPKYVNGLFAMGRIEIRRGNAQPALEYLNNALTFAIQLENEEQRADLLNAIGVAYKRLNKPDEALRHYQESLVIKRRIGQKRGIAVHARRGRPGAKSSGAVRRGAGKLQGSRELQREIGDKRGLGTTLINLGTFHAIAVNTIRDCSCSRSRSRSSGRPGTRASRRSA